jgi:hypothetical protein
MDRRIEKVIEAFTNKGWKRIGSLNVSQEWWFDDIILLEFVWTPLGKNLYLTLLTDPMEIKRKTVWAISLSATMPEQKNYKSISQLALNDVKKTNLENFVKSINELIL